MQLVRFVWERIEDRAKAEGYSSPQEFVEHVLEKELRGHDDGGSRDEVLKKLKGLGYVK